jgi:hypothetical protein
VGIRDGVEIAPGRFLLLRHDDSFLVLDDDGLTEATYVHDDPTTAAVETPVDVPEGEPSWWRLSARLGTAWVAGYGGIGRATLGRDDVTVETFWLERLSGGDYADVERLRPPRFTAIGVTCPDEGILLSAERVFRNELTSPKSAVLAWVLGEELRSLETFANFGVTQAQAPSAASWPAGVTIADDGATELFFNDGVIYRDGTPRTVAPFKGVREVVRADRFTLIGGVDGRMAAVVETP